MCFVKIGSKSKSGFISSHVNFLSPAGMQLRFSEFGKTNSFISCISPLDEVVPQLNGRVNFILNPEMSGLFVGVKTLFLKQTDVTQVNDSSICYSASAGWRSPCWSARQAWLMRSSMEQLKEVMNVFTKNSHAAASPFPSSFIWLVLWIQCGFITLLHI